MQLISETVAMLPLCMYRKMPDGSRQEAPSHPIAQLFQGEPNDWQTGAELVEMLTAHCLLRGVGYAEIEFDGRGAPVALHPYHPDWVYLVTIRRSATLPPSYRYDVSLPQGGTRRLLPEQMFVLRDRTDDGITPKSRLARARETFGNALATERFASSTFRNGASMSGVLSHPEQLGDDAAQRLRKDFEQTYSGADNAGRIAILEEGLKWQAISVSPDDAKILESRRFGVENLARIFYGYPPLLGDFQGGNYSSMKEIGQWHYAHTIAPWLTRWDKQISRSLLSADGRRQYEPEFDADLLVRTDMLTRYQSYRIAREIGLANANELRKWEHLNPRTDTGGEEYLSPMNMASEQTQRPIADRGANA